MKRLTVYERLKPEIKESLHSPENDKYKSSIDAIVQTFSSTTFYSDLKISDVSSLYNVVLEKV
jgi:DNA-binding protein Fis